MAGYNLRLTTPTQTTTTFVAGTTQALSLADGQGAYSFQVQAEDNAGNWSAYSASCGSARA